MPHVQTSAPAVEPITLAEAKTFMRVDTSADDALIDALITTSRLQLEDTLDIAFIQQTWSFLLDAWPATGDIPLPVSPAAQLLAVRTYDADDIATPVPLASFQLDTASRVPRIVRKTTFSTAASLRPLNGIEISYRAGFGATPSSVPEPLRQALRLLVAHWYDHRDPADVTKPGAKIPADVSALVAPFRRPRLA